MIRANAHNTPKYKNHWHERVSLIEGVGVQLPRVILVDVNRRECETLPDVQAARGEDRRFGPRTIFRMAKLPNARRQA